MHAYSCRKNGKDIGYRSNIGEVRRFPSLPVHAARILLYNKCTVIDALLFPDNYQLRS